MSAILNSFNVHKFPIFQPILMKLVSKFMVYRALSDKRYLLSGLLSPLINCQHLPIFRSQAAIVSEKSTVFTFSHRKAYVTKFDLAVK